MAILVVAEHDNKSLKNATRSAVSAAQLLGGDIHVLIAGSECANVANAAMQIAGVSEVKVADAAHLADQLPENLAALVAAQAGGYSHILAAATANGKSFMPRVAALLDVAQISDIVRIQDPETFVRPTYAGNAMVTVQSLDRVKVLTVRTAAFAIAVSGGSAVIECISATADTGLSKLGGQEIVTSARPELADAKVVVSGGRGMGSKENFQSLLEPLADRLGAALGASRAAVDAGYAPNECQVGQTGKIVAPQLYLAIGVSGAIQHLAGMKDSKVIVAINKDPDAPIFGVADYGLVADLFEAIPQLTAALGSVGTE